MADPIEAKIRGIEREFDLTPKGRENLQELEKSFGEVLLMGQYLNF